MYLRRDFLVKKQLNQNKNNQADSMIYEGSMEKMKKLALEQLTMGRIKNRQMEYHKIEIFLLVASERDMADFYSQLKVGLQDIFSDDKIKKIFEEKWTHSVKSNVMGLFNNIARDFYDRNSVQNIFSSVYTDTIVKLMKDDKLSRIEEKFLDCFLIETMNRQERLETLGATNLQAIKIGTEKVKKSMAQREIPKNLSNNHFLQYSVISLLHMEIPHEKYLYNQLLHAPNPKFLLPFRRKGVFPTLTNEILIKLNKIDMVGLRYWSYYEYEECDLYPSIRKAAGWQYKINIMLSTLKEKMKSGLEKYMNLINEKIKFYPNRNFDEAIINEIASYSEICLEICQKKDPKEHSFSTALEKVDLGQVFQEKKILEEFKFKECMQKLVHLYLQLVTFCSKKNLKLKFIQKIVKIICILLRTYKDEKFKQDVVKMVLKTSEDLSEEEKMEMLYISIDHVNREWEKQQELANNEIVKVSPFIVGFIADISFHFGFEDYGRVDYKVLKLEFFYIMAINFKESDYFESKKKLSLATIDINHPLSNNMIFNILEVRKIFYEAMKKHLRSVYGEYQLDRPEHEGLLAIIDEIISFRIQTVKENLMKDGTVSFYSLLYSLLEQIERADPSCRLLTYVKNYFLKCNKTYMIEMGRLKVQDNGKKIYCQLLKLDVAYVVEGTISANPILSEFCENILLEYVEKYPELAFHPKILTVLAECISVLYKKSTQQYESKAEKLKGKHLISNILIPNNTKEITKRMTILMTALYQIILQGYLINDNYLRIRILYLVKENAKTANITFGWKFLKHLIGNFKEDKQFMISELFLNNSGAWFINEELFTRKVRQMKPQKILLDKHLLPLHDRKCSSADLKKIFMTVEPQIEVEFIIVPPKSTESEIDHIISELQLNCAKVEQLWEQEHHHHHHQEEVDEHQNRLYAIVSRIKTIHISDSGAFHVLSSLLAVASKYNNQDLFKYILLKVVPLLYCMTETVLKSLSILSQTLFFIVNELNNVGKLYLEERNSDKDTFNMKTDYFGHSIKEYERNEDSEFYNNMISHISHSKTPSKRYMVLRLHEKRLYSLKKMYRYILQFLSDHFDVYVAVGVPLMEFTQIFKMNFLIHTEILEFVSLESIGYCLTSHLELVNLLKSSVQKGEVQYDDTFIDEFYFQTLRMGLMHFQKRKTYYEEDLLKKNTNIKSIKTKITFFIQICDYLRNDDFHRFRKKKLPKREEIYQGSKNNQENMLVSILKYTQKPNHFERGNALSLQDDATLVNSRISNFVDFDVDMGILRYALLYLVSEQVDRIKAFSYMELREIENSYSLAGKKNFINHGQILKLYDYFGDKSSVLIYTFVKVFGNRIDNCTAILDRIKEAITKKPDYGFPEFLGLFVEKNLHNKQLLKKINYWKPPNVQILFRYLSREYEDSPYLELYVTKVLGRLNSEQILFYLPQIYQALTLPRGRIVYDFLLEYARKSASFAHQLIWISKVESKQEKDPHNKNPRLPGVDDNLQKLQKVSNALIQDIIRQFSREEKSFFKEVDQFYEVVTAVSGKLDPKWPFSQKKERIQEQLEKIQVPHSVYLPTNPFFQVLKLKSDSGIPMQSAAKCPFLLTFVCKKYVGPDIDFEERKKRKKNNRFLETDEQIEKIRKEQIPGPLPAQRRSKVGGKIGISRAQIHSSRTNSNMNKEEINSNGDSNLRIEVNDIHFTMEEPMVRQKEQKQQKEWEKNLKGSQMGQRKGKNQSSKESQLPQSVPEMQVSCIFKVFDDIRQDSLALQVIQLFGQIFQKHDLELKLFPYKTISNRTGKGLDIGGIIEVVPKTVSRDSIGKTNEQSLYEFFISNFGPEYNSVFQEARQNFIRSQAAYSIISYILQIKDRHNGNILINKEEGYLVHIDFGFIFDISPANNLRFEKADFKLTEEMIKIMGGKIESEPFQLYMNLVIKGFLIVRKYHEHIINLVKLMFNSGLPCFLEKSLTHLEQRFVLEMSEIEAAEYMKKIILKAADHWTTNWYDKIQWIQQRIYH